MSVTVVGRGAVALPPDLAVVELACEGVAATPAEALATAGSGLDRVRAVLLESGVGADGLRSTEFSLWAETDPQGQPRGYRAVRGLSAEVPDIGRVGELVSAAIGAGGATSRVRGLSLRASGAATARVQARDLAFADALATAEQLAGRAGRTLGPVTEIVDGEPAAGGPVPVARAFALAKDSAGPVDPGQLEVTAAVTVTWDLA